MIPKLIKTETDYQDALTRVEEIFQAKPGTAEADELELLTILVERYEDEHFPIGLPTPVEAIKFRMDQQALKRKDLVPFIGSESKVSEVLSGKRSLSLTMIRNLVTNLGISAEVLLQKPEGQLCPNTLINQERRFPVAEI